MAASFSGGTLTLTCGTVNLGPAGHVAIGGSIGGLPDEPYPPQDYPGPNCSEFRVPAACWLTDTGTVSCARCRSTGIATKNYFRGRKVVDIAFNYYGNNLCAVTEDGSLWCLGTNRNGMLGTGDANPRTIETQVQPAGTVRTTCQ